jgi:hypothetical protein
VSVVLWYVRPTLVVRTVALVGTLFFGLCGVYAIVKLFDRRPGLILDHEGIVGAQSFLTIDVRDPRRFVERGGALRRLLNRANVGIVGSAINISTIGLAISREELGRHVAAFYAAYGRRG